MIYNKNNLKNTIQVMPAKPGVYYMIDDNLEIIYIGKAKDLRKRVSSYFNSTEKSSKIEKMVSLVVNIKYQVCKNETEALILEAKEINLHSPKYNTLLKDDKSFYFIVISQDKYPLLKIIHEKDLDSAANIDHFGPFMSKYHAQKILDLTRKITGFRVCSNTDFANRTRPCLDYHIKLCSAPCVNKISLEEYTNRIKDVILLIKNNKNDLVSQLQSQMNLLISETKFEEAIDIRKQIHNIYRLVKDREYFEIDNVDVIIINNNIRRITVAIIRYYKNYGTKEIRFDEFDEIERIIISLYQHRPIPQRILIKTEQDFNTQSIQVILSKSNKLLEIKINRFSINESQLIEKIHKLTSRSTNSSQREVSITYLKGLIDISNINRIEIFDNSHNQGNNPVSVAVVANSNGFITSEYQKIEYSTNCNDDYKMMYEIVSSRLDKINSNIIKKPDLLIVDGGIGQINIARNAMQKYNLDIPIIGIAKGENHDDNNDTIVLPDGTKIPMSKNDKRLHYLQQLRDEAHRFAINKHRNISRKQSTKSELDSIHGLGKKRKKDLLLLFSSISEIKHSSIEELQKVKGIGRKLAQDILDHLSSTNEG